MNNWMAENATKVGFRHVDREDSSGIIRNGRNSLAAASLVRLVEPAESIESGEDGRNLIG